MARVCEVATLKLTLVEGGDWWEIEVHSLEMPRGAQWDAVNGWRHDVDAVMGETGNDGALDRRYGPAMARRISALREQDAHVKQRQRHLKQLLRDKRLRLRRLPEAERERLYEDMYESAG